ncbi:hypothetical protein Runsl_0055 [Runella slithyformis DSM 19594]|uniref:Uncharacterized protein n=1 Tax=Runella slithyformis (strain ATCC 29530 / DSM 19594 / LMG 11500 / NCIMB 11436 / LSU 4) TaxID=761193 RepID=A0A7U4E3Y4_RUNSL|nr:hypothetical protein Runsl_0055 [Runella slithyformis DSM 19594]
MKRLKYIQLIYSLLKIVYLSHSFRARIHFFDKDLFFLTIKA